MGGCQNYGPFLGVHLEGDIDIDVHIDTDSRYGWLSKLWSLSTIWHYVGDPKGDHNFDDHHPMSTVAGVYFWECAPARTRGSPNMCNTILLSYISGLKSGLYANQNQEPK